MIIIIIIIYNIKRESINLNLVYYHIQHNIMNKHLKLLIGLIIITITVSHYYLKYKWNVLTELKSLYTILFFFNYFFSILMMMMMMMMMMALIILMMMMIRIIIIIHFLKFFFSLCMVL